MKDTSNEDKKPYEDAAETIDEQVKSNIGSTKLFGKRK